MQNIVASNFLLLLLLSSYYILLYIMSMALRLTSKVETFLQLLYLWYLK